MQQRKGFSNATQRLEAETEVENAPRRRQALQADRDGKAAAHAFGKASPARNEGRQAHAQAEKADAGEPRGQSEDHADVALRIVDLRIGKSGEGRTCRANRAPKHLA